MQDVAITVSHVSKNFILPHQKANSIKSMFTSLAAKRRRTIDVQHALKDVSFEVKKGEFFGIVGRNGSGKSTLLKILAEIYQPTSGYVRHTGKLVPFIELGVGFNPELTGRENVYLNGAMLGFSRKEITAMYDDIVHFAELERFMDQKLKNYSSGMQVRLAFSMATRSKADILLVDEVLAVGDTDFQRKCFEYFRNLKAERKTVVFVSHDMNAVREYCDRAVLIENSRIVKEGTSDKIAAEYAIMFLEGSDSRASQTSGDRWGSGDVQISGIVANGGETALTPKDDMLKVTFGLKAIRKASNVCCGFQIRNGAGELITGINTQMLNRKIPDMKAGEARKYTWSIQNIFAEGVHVLSLAVEANNNTADWIESAAKVNVLLEQRTPFIVNPHIEIHEG